jgi:hypothetical protein
LLSRQERAAGRPERAAILHDRALVACSRAVELNPRSAPEHVNLGRALETEPDLDAAAGEYRKAIELDPNLPLAHYNLSLVLLQQGRFADARAEMEAAHRLGTATPGWSFPSDQWVKQERRLAELDATLPAVLDGRAMPAEAGVQTEYAAVSKIKGRFGASARLYAGAFAAERALAATSDRRFQAACAAALAGAGPASDVPEADASERARWRKQALEWLRADLALRTKILDYSHEGNRAAIQGLLQRWRSEKDLAGLREPEALARLPESERADCIRFWADVEGLLARCLADPPGK